MTIEYHGQIHQVDNEEDLIRTIAKIRQGERLGRFFLAVHNVGGFALLVAGATAFLYWLVTP